MTKIELSTGAGVAFAGELSGLGWIGATDRENEATLVYQHSKLQVLEKYWSVGRTK